MTFVKRVAWIVKNPSRRQLAFSAGALLLLLLLVGLSLFILLNGSMGWFARNRVVDGNTTSITPQEKKINVLLYDDEMTLVGELSGGDPVPFDLDIPGSSVTFVIRVQNLSDGPVSVDRIFFFAPENGEEVPVILPVDGTPTDHYFSTQLAVKTVNVTPADGTAPTAAAVATALSGNDDGTLMAPAAPPGEYVLQNTSVSVENGRSEYLAVKVTFRNLPTEQNAYCNFGEDDNGQDPAPCCTRRVGVNFS